MLYAPIVIRLAEIVENNRCIQEGRVDKMRFSLRFVFWTIAVVNTELLVWRNNFTSGGAPFPASLIEKLQFSEVRLSATNILSSSQSLLP